MDGHMPPIAARRRIVPAVNHAAKLHSCTHTHSLLAHTLALYVLTHTVLHVRASGGAFAYNSYEYMPGESRVDALRIVRAPTRVCAGVRPPQTGETETGGPNDIVVEALAGNEWNALVRQTATTLRDAVTLSIDSFTPAHTDCLADDPYLIHMLPHAHGELHTATHVSALLLSGVASFSNLTFPCTGNYTLQVLFRRILRAAVGPIEVVPGPAARLSVCTPPSTARGGTPFQVQPVVCVVDDWGIPAAWTNLTNAWVQASADDDSGGPLLGDTCAPVVRARARFRQLQFNEARAARRVAFRLLGRSNATSPCGGDHVMQHVPTPFPALCPAAAPYAETAEAAISRIAAQPWAVTDAFSVSIGPAARLELVAAMEPIAYAGQPFRVQPALRLLDAGGNVVEHEFTQHHVCAQLEVVEPQWSQTQEWLHTNTPQLLPRLVRRRIPHALLRADVEPGSEYLVLSRDPLTLPAEHVLRHGDLVSLYHPGATDEGVCGEEQPCEWPPLQPPIHNAVALPEFSSPHPEALRQMNILGLSGTFASPAYRAHLNKTWAGPRIVGYGLTRWVAARTRQLEWGRTQFDGLSISAPGKYRIYFHLASDPTCAGVGHVQSSNMSSIFTRTSTITVLPRPPAQLVFLREAAGCWAANEPCRVQPVVAVADALGHVLEDVADGHLMHCSVAYAADVDSRTGLSRLQFAARVESGVAVFEDIRMLIESRPSAVVANDTVDLVFGVDISGHGHLQGFQRVRALPSASFQLPPLASYVDERVLQSGLSPPPAAHWSTTMAYGSSLAAARGVVAIGAPGERVVLPDSYVVRVLGATTKSIQEVQTVEIAGTWRPEIHEIVICADAPTNAAAGPPLQGEMVLSWSGARARSLPVISHEDYVKTVLQQDLFYYAGGTEGGGRMAALWVQREWLDDCSAAQVSTAGSTPARRVGWRWHVRYDNMFGDIPLLEVDVSGVTGDNVVGTVAPIQKATQLGGSFRLAVTMRIVDEDDDVTAYAGDIFPSPVDEVRTTRQISTHASLTDILIAVQQDLGVEVEDIVDESRGNSEAEYEQDFDIGMRRRMLRIAFRVSDDNCRIPLLRPLPANVTGFEARMTTRRLQRAQCAVSGGFRLLVGTRCETTTIPCSAPAAALQRALTACDGVVGASVTPVSEAGALVFASATGSAAVVGSWHIAMFVDATLPAGVAVAPGSSSTLFGTGAFVEITSAAYNITLTPTERQLLDLPSDGRLGSVGAVYVYEVARGDPDLESKTPWDAAEVLRPGPAYAPLAQQRYGFSIALEYSRESDEHVLLVGAPAARAIPHNYTICLTCTATQGRLSIRSDALLEDTVLDVSANAAALGAAIALHCEGGTRVRSAHGPDTPICGSGDAVCVNVEPPDPRTRRLPALIADSTDSNGNAYFWEGDTAQDRGAGAGAITSGAVYVYSRRPGDTHDVSWTLQTRWTPLRPSDFDGAEFGASLALSATGVNEAEWTAAVGVPFAQSSGKLHVGSVSVYHRSLAQGQTWSLHQTLLPTEMGVPAVSGSQFGASVSFAADGDTLAIGAPGGGVSGCGVVYTFKRQPDLGALFFLDQALRPVYPTANFAQLSSSALLQLFANASTPVPGIQPESCRDSWRFGAAVAFGNVTLAVGAPHMNASALLGGNFGSGAVFLYNRTGWGRLDGGYLGLEAIYTAAEVGGVDDFGGSVAGNDRFMLVGSTHSGLFAKAPSIRAPHLVVELGWEVEVGGAPISNPGEAECVGYLRVGHRYTIATSPDSDFPTRVLRQTRELPCNASTHAVSRALLADLGVHVAQIRKDASASRVTWELSIPSMHVSLVDVDATFVLIGRVVVKHSSAVHEATLFAAPVLRPEQRDPAHVLLLGRGGVEERTAWRPQAWLHPIQTYAGDGFGFSLALDSHDTVADMALIGAPLRWLSPTDASAPSPPAAMMSAGTAFAVSLELSALTFAGRSGIDGILDIEEREDEVRVPFAAGNKPTTPSTTTARVRAFARVLAGDEAAELLNGLPFAANSDMLRIGELRPATAHCSRICESATAMAVRLVDAGSEFEAPRSNCEIGRKTAAGAFIAAQGDASQCYRRADAAGSCDFLDFGWRPLVGMYSSDALLWHVKEDVGALATSPGSSAWQVPVVQDDVDELHGEILHVVLGAAGITPTPGGAWWRTLRLLDRPDAAAASASAHWEAASEVHLLAMQAPVAVPNCEPQQQLAEFQLVSTTPAVSITTAAGWTFVAHASVLAFMHPGCPALNISVGAVVVHDGVLEMDTAVSVMIPPPSVVNASAPNFGASLAALAVRTGSDAGATTRAALVVASAPGIPALVMYICEEHFNAGVAEVVCALEQIVWIDVNADLQLRNTGQLRGVLPGDGCGNPGTLAMEHAPASGVLAAVGCPGADVVMVYKRRGDGARWSFLAVLQSSQHKVITALESTFLVSMPMRFGSAVTMSAGGVIVVGAPHAPGDTQALHAQLAANQTRGHHALQQWMAAHSAGEVFVFHHVAGLWTANLTLPERRAREAGLPMFPWKYLTDARTTADNEQHAPLMLIDDAEGVWVQSTRLAPPPADLTADSFALETTHVQHFGAGVKFVTPTQLIVEASHVNRGQEITWDFETGDLRGWIVQGTAFAQQPSRRQDAAPHFWNAMDATKTVRARAVPMNDVAASDGREPMQGAKGRYFVSSREVQPPLFRQVPLGHHPSAAWYGRLSMSALGNASHLSPTNETLGAMAQSQGCLATGTLHSLPFRIEGSRIRFLIGGGCDSDRTFIQLRVDGRIVRRASGDCTNRMRKVTWAVADLRGSFAAIEVADRDVREPWGFIDVDEFAFDWEILRSALAQRPPGVFVYESTQLTPHQSPATDVQSAGHALDASPVNWVQTSIITPPRSNDALSNYGWHPVTPCTQTSGAFLWCLWMLSGELIVPGAPVAGAAALHVVSLSEDGADWIVIGADVCDERIMPFGASALPLEASPGSRSSIPSCQHNGVAANQDIVFAAPYLHINDDAPAARPVDEHLASASIGDDRVGWQSGSTGMGSSAHGLRGAIKSVLDAAAAPQGTCTHHRTFSVFRRINEWYGSSNAGEQLIVAGPSWQRAAVVTPPAHHSCVALSTALLPGAQLLSAISCQGDHAPRVVRLPLHALRVSFSTPISDPTAAVINRPDPAAHADGDARYTVAENTAWRRVTIPIYLDERGWTHRTKEVRVFYGTADVTARGVEASNVRGCKFAACDSGCGDYVEAMGEIVFAPGVTRRDIVIGIVDDSCPEPRAEHFRIDLYLPGGTQLQGEQFSVTVQIDDDDHPRELVRQSIFTLGDGDPSPDATLPASVDFEHEEAIVDDATVQGFEPSALVRRIAQQSHAPASSRAEAGPALQLHKSLV